MIPDAQVMRHQGPLLAPVAAAYTLLFLAGLYPVTVFGGEPYCPGPWEPVETIAAFFQARPTAVRICAFSSLARRFRSASSPRRS
jgi:hypothetical protein